MTPAVPRNSQTDSGEHQLAALRQALDSRLATLEEVLADPSRGESLESLILDLSRLATEEAQASAARACLIAKVEADKQVAEARLSLQAALDQERTLVSELRGAVKQARERIASLEDEKQAAVRAVREELAAGMTRERQSASEIKQALTEAQEQIKAERESSKDLMSRLEAERESSRELRLQVEAERASGLNVQSDLDAERLSSGALRAAAEHAEARAVALERDLAKASALEHELADARARAQDLAEAQAALDREQARMQAAYDGVAAELTRQREVAPALDLARREAQAKLAAEQTSGSRARTELEAERAVVSQLRAELDAERSAVVQLHAELEAERAGGGELRAQLDALRASSDELRRDAELADRRLSSALGDNVQALALQDQLRTEIEKERAEAARVAAALQDAQRELSAIRQGHVAPPAAAPGSAPTQIRPPAQAATAAEAEGWEGVRLDTRYVFPEDLEININGVAGKLVDLSTSGCQILSPSPLSQNQVATLQLPFDEISTTCTCRVVWARAEPPVGGRSPGVRAGLRFTQADQSEVEAFVIRYAKPM